MEMTLWTLSWTLRCPSTVFNAVFAEHSSAAMPGDDREGASARQSPPKAPEQDQGKGKLPGSIDDGLHVL